MHETPRQYAINTPSRRRCFYRRLGALFLQYAPVICALFIVAVAWHYGLGHVPAYVRGQHTLLYRLGAIGISLLWFGFAFLASLYLGFCGLHRGLLSYAYAAFLALYIDRWTDFGAFRPYACWLLVVVGTALLCFVLHKIIRKKPCTR